ncbi:uncharacterized protein [Dermacentor albipictus]|uniref:uncharacterized protein n=1 Tax=Dermacentor albipictus TaxID=60249 RepID=UPI0031FD52F5
MEVENMGDCTDTKEKVEIACILARILAAESEADAAKAVKDRIKRQLLLNGCTFYALALPTRVCNRSTWAFIRHEKWFEETVPHLGGHNFKQSFRVNPSTFRFLVESLRHVLEKQVTNMRDPITAEKRVAIGLYKLCSSAEDRTVANLFGVGRSSVNVIYREFCAAVVSVLESDWIRMITEEEMPRHIQEFEAVCDFPQAVGALDGCHFPISPPKKYATDYYNYKGWHIIILLALVDHKYRFRYCNVGAPGRCHDAHVFGVSRLSKIVNSPLFKAPVAAVGTTAVPPIILCDQAFPLTPNLMKPFGHRTVISEAERNFNCHLSGARRIVENAFGRLKARFRFIAKRMECSVGNARLAIRACCVLNNICEHFNDSVHPQWLSEVQQSNATFPQPSRRTEAEIGNASAIRTALVEYYKRRN